MELHNLSHQISQKGTWTIEEEQILTERVQEFGMRNWNQVAMGLPGRIAK